MDFSVFHGMISRHCGKKYAFAIISRLAKSLGNSIWNKKHEKYVTGDSYSYPWNLEKRCTRNRRGAFLEDSGVPIRGHPVLNAIRMASRFSYVLLYTIAFAD